MVTIREVGQAEQGQSSSSSSAGPDLSNSQFLTKLKGFPLVQCGTNIASILYSSAKVKIIINPKERRCHEFHSSKMCKN
jgi:hypothetical protein